MASALAVQKVRDLSISLAGTGDAEKKDLLKKCAMTTLNSKLVCRNVLHSSKNDITLPLGLQVSGEKEFFAQMVVDAVSKLDPVSLDLKLIGMKKVQGGGLRDSFLVDGVAFKKTFSYAGFEQQPKSFDDPKVLLLNMELEIKSERENAEVSYEHGGTHRCG